jgi:hypothetical protein
MLSGDRLFNPIEESRRRGIVGRLRERYSEAREIVSAREPDVDHHGNLDWILGVRRDRGQDDATWDSRVAELVVLWLEDFLLELDGLAFAPFRSDPVATPASSEDSRRSVARALRNATREFAEAFLTERAMPASGP